MRAPCCIAEAGAPEQEAERMQESLDKRRKRLIFRARHRGTKEMDLFIGGFMARYLDELTDAQLDRFEALLEVPEPVMQDWVMGRAAPPPEFDNDVTALLLDFKIYPARS
jgi:antitoxin CptB